MGKVYVGIVEAPPPQAVTVGVVQDDGRRMTGSTFAVERAHLHEYYVPQANGSHRYEMPADLFRLGGFLNETISPDSRVRYLFEVPEIVPHPQGGPRAVPYPVLPADSVILKVLVLLGVNNIVVAPFRTDPQFQTAVLLPVLRDGDLAQFRDRSPRYLSKGICRAYGELLGLTCERAEHIAIVGALIAKNPGLFHFWSSVGQVQSAHDVLTDLRTGARGPRSVYSANESYITDYTAVTVRDRIEDIPLEYAETQKRFEHLGHNDAIKAALIRVCQQWHIDLRCNSTRPDTDDPDAEYIVDPLAAPDRFLIMTLQHAEQEHIWPDGRQPS